MKHIKLPLVKLESEPRIDGADGLLFMYTEDHDDGEIAELITACNEHDTLKAKAELLDKTVESLKCVSFPVKGRTLLEAAVELAVIANALIAKAKALK